MASSFFPSRSKALRRHHVSRSRPSWTLAASSKPRPCSSCSAVHDSASLGACCQASVRQASVSESSRVYAMMALQSSTVPPRRRWNKTRVSASSSSTFLAVFHEGSGTSCPPWRAKSTVMKAMASGRSFSGGSRSSRRPPEIWFVAFCNATLMSGSLTPAPASFRTVMTSSLLRGSTQKKSVFILVAALVFVALAFGKARN